MKIVNLVQNYVNTLPVSQKIKILNDSFGEDVSGIAIFEKGSLLDQLHEKFDQYILVENFENPNSLVLGQTILYGDIQGIQFSLDAALNRCGCPDCLNERPFIIEKYAENDEAYKEKFFTFLHDFFEIKEV